MERFIFESRQKNIHTEGKKNLNLGEDSGLLEVLALNLGAGGVLDISTRVELEKLSEVELGGLEDLDLADKDVTEGVDRLARLLNLGSNDLGDELLDELLQVAGRGLGDHDLEHLLADLTDLSSLGVGGLLDLVDSLLGEGNSKEAEQVTVGGLDIDVSLNDGLLKLFEKKMRKVGQCLVYHVFPIKKKYPRFLIPERKHKKTLLCVFKCKEKKKGSYLPLADHGAELVRGHVHTVEVGEAVLALDLINTQLDLAERVLLALVQVSEGDLEDTALQGIVGVLHTLGAVDEGLADVANLKGRRSLDIVPVLAGEGVDAIFFR
jgi:hypothetical protein